MDVWTPTRLFIAQQDACDQGQGGRGAGPGQAWAATRLLAVTHPAPALGNTEQVQLSGGVTSGVEDGNKDG